MYTSTRYWTWCRSPGDASEVRTGRQWQRVFSRPCTVVICADAASETPCSGSRVRWYLCVYVFIRTHTHMYIYMYRYLCVYVFIRTHTHMYIYIYIYIHIYIYIGLCVYIYTCMCVRRCVCVCMYVLYIQVIQRYWKTILSCRNTGVLLMCC